MSHRVAVLGPRIATFVCSRRVGRYNVHKGQDLHYTNTGRVEPMVTSCFCFPDVVALADGKQWKMVEVIRIGLTTYSEAAQFITTNILPRRKVTK